VRLETGKLFGALVIAASVGVALLLYFFDAATQNHGAPPPTRDASWRWAAAAPGMNVYYADRLPSSGGVVSVWIDRRLFSNPSGIRKDLVEPWDFDCRQQRTRQQANYDGTAPTRAQRTWSTPRAGSALDRLMDSVCADVDARNSR
jgi:hypothetical protein